MLGFGKAAVAALVVEPLNSNHARELADIHATSFHRPWTDGEFYELLSRPAVAGFLIRQSNEKGGEPVGFVLARSAADETEILTVVVQGSWRRLGAGRRLMAALLEKAHLERQASVFLEVDEQNKAAVALYRNLGFIEVAQRPDYYQTSNEHKSSALVMRRDVS